MSVNLGKIAITIGDNHVISKEYERLTIVEDAASGRWYISRWDVPANIPLTNLGYWKLFFDPNMNSQQVAQNAQDIVQLFSDVQNIETQIATLLPKVGGTITGDLEVNGNLTKGGRAVADIVTHRNPLLGISTLPSNFDPNTVQNGNPDHVNMLSNHANTPTSAVYWHINTQWYSTSDNCRQIAVQYVGGRAQTFVRARYNGAWTAWEMLSAYGADTGWTHVSKINGWTGYVYYKKWRDGTVTVTGAPRNSSGSSSWSNRQIGTLPAGFRPGTTLFASAASNRHNAGGVPRAYIDTQGRLYCETIGDYYMYFTFTYKAEY